MPWISSPMCRSVTVPFGSTGENSDYVTDKVGGKLIGFIFIMNFTCVFRKQRDKDVSKYHIQLCCVCIGILLVFGIGIDRAETFGGCVTASVFIHYFTLVAVMWMGGGGGGGGGGPELVQPRTTFGCQIN